MPEYNYLSWREIDLDTERLHEQIEEVAPHSRIIIGVQRGGLIPAVMLSHSLKAPLVTIPVSHYDEHNECSTLSIGEFSLIDKVTNYRYVLVVDDIYDTGDTLKGVIDKLISCLDGEQEVICCTLTSKVPDVVVNPRFPKVSFKTGEFVDPECWVVFPWEQPSD